MQDPKLWGLGWLATASFLLLPPVCRAAYSLDLDSDESIKSVAREITDDMMSYYNGDEPGGTPGLLPDPYYWWEAGAMFGALIDYWYFTGDEEYNNVTTNGLLSQVGPVEDYMPPSQRLTEGNDDQGFWGLAVMAAAEYNFPNPPKDKPQWLALAQAVFNTQAPRWDMEHCNGGLRWQIFNWNKGFNYKNSISMACFFALGARLALYTGNGSYAEWADITWDWMIGAGFLNPESYYIYDGAHIETNCTDIVPYQWSYNAGGFLHGAAAMYNFTGSDVWRDRVDKLLEATGVFFGGPDNNIMTEVACEPVNLCDVDQQSFKAYLSRWLAVTTKWAPWTYDTIQPWLRASADAAVKTCVAGENNRLCGLKWSSNATGGWDPNDLTGVGQQMAAMEVLIANLVHQVDAPLSSDTGGTSQGDPGAGTEDIGRTELHGFEWAKMDAGDRAGAWMVTLVLIFAMLTAIAFMVIDDWDRDSWQKRKLAALSLVHRTRSTSLPWTDKPRSAPADTGSSTARKVTFKPISAINGRHAMAAVGDAIGGAAAGVKSRVSSKRKNTCQDTGLYSFMAVGNDQAMPGRATVIPPVPAAKVTRWSGQPAPEDSSSSAASSRPIRRSVSTVSNSERRIGGSTASKARSSCSARPNSYPNQQMVTSNAWERHQLQYAPEFAHLVEPGLAENQATPERHPSRSGAKANIAHSTSLRSSNSAGNFTRNTLSQPGVATRTPPQSSSVRVCSRQSTDGYIHHQPPPKRTSHPVPEQIAAAISDRL